MSTNWVHCLQLALENFSADINVHVHVNQLKYVIVLKGDLVDPVNFMYFIVYPLVRIHNTGDEASACAGEATGC